MLSSVPFSISIVRRYEIEEDGGYSSGVSGKKAQINRKANMVLLSRVFQ